MPHARRKGNGARTSRSSTAITRTRYTIGTKLGPGAKLRGPAIVEERESTVVIGPRGAARVDDVLNLIAELV